MRRLPDTYKAFVLTDEKDKYFVKVLSVKKVYENELDHFKKFHINSVKEGFYFELFEFSSIKDRNNFIQFLKDKKYKHH